MTSGDSPSRTSEDDAMPRTQRQRPADSPDNRASPRNREHDREDPAGSEDQGYRSSPVQQPRSNGDATPDKHRKNEGPPHSPGRDRGERDRLEDRAGSDRRQPEQDARPQRAPYHTGSGARDDRPRQFDRREPDDRGWRGGPPGGRGYNGDRRQGGGGPGGGWRGPPGPRDGHHRGYASRDGGRRRSRSRSRDRDRGRDYDRGRDRRDDHDRGRDYDRGGDRDRYRDSGRDRDRDRRRSRSPKGGRNRSKSRSRSRDRRRRDSRSKSRSRSPSRRRDSTKRSSGFAAAPTAPAAAAGVGAVPFIPPLPADPLEAVRRMMGAPGVMPVTVASGASTAGLTAAQKRALLWGSKKAEAALVKTSVAAGSTGDLPAAAAAAVANVEGPAVAGQVVGQAVFGANRWDAAEFSTDAEKAKFLKIMGVKDATQVPVPVAPVQADAGRAAMTRDVQDKVLSSIEEAYARGLAQTGRTSGLGL